LVKREYFRIRKLVRKYDRKTGKFVIDIRYKAKTEITPRTIGVAEAFGLGVDNHKEHVIYDDVTIKISPRDIVYLTGDSGSGKSVLLRALEKDLKGEAVNVESIQPDPDQPIVETVGRDLDEALGLLSRVGLNDAYLFLRRYGQLSDGQKYRYRIAKLIESGKQWWILDEFAATLDRDTAKIVAFNLQKQARRTGKAVVAATTHTDLFEDLAPSVHIHKGWGKKVQVKYYPNSLNRVCSVTHGLRIEEATMKDYRQLAEFHYRNPETHAPPLKIFTMKRESGTAVGLILYSWPPIAARGRRQALGKILSINELNEKLATISRVILHPKFRSIGLGVRLVKETLPLVGRPYVETIAVMARYNPFFEKAGLKKIIESQGHESVRHAVGNLEKLGFKRYTLASTETNLQLLKTFSKEELEEIKAILLTVSTGYYKRLKSTSKPYVKREEFKEFLEEASLETIAKIISRLAVLAQTKVYLFWQNPNLEV